MIPKILHLTWKTAALPRYLQRYFGSWQRLCASWDIRLWTDETMRGFVAERYPEMLATYDGYPRNIQRADIFRYMVLGALGGVYADLDVEALRPIDELLGLDCFVGIEPFEHVGPDRRHAGMGYMLSNAFMGSVPGHPLWQKMLELAPEAARQGDVFQSTGPMFLIASVLGMPRDRRPVGLLPQVWSPRRDGGKPARATEADVAVVRRSLKVFGGDGAPLVSHDWLTTWVPWHVKHHGWTMLYRWPTVIKWALRERRLPAIDAKAFPKTGAVYDDQLLEGNEQSARIYLGLYLPPGGRWNPDLANVLEGLDYPRDRLTVALYTGDATGALVGVQATLASEFGEVRIIESGGSPIALRNRLLEEGAAVADKVLLVAGDLTSMPTSLVEALSNSGPDIVVPVVGGDDLATYRYVEPPSFRYLYKHGARDGVLIAGRGGRQSPRSTASFRLLPVDGVSPRCLLISSRAIKAGVRFPETPYKFHADGDGLPLLARDLGFEAAARNDIVVE